MINKIISTINFSYTCLTLSWQKTLMKNSSITKEQWQKLAKETTEGANEGKGGETNMPT